MFRMKHEFLRRSGLLERQFPVNPEMIPAPALHQVQIALQNWPWKAREGFRHSENQDSGLQKEVEELLNVRIRLFQNISYQLSDRNDWHRHPETGFVYDKNRHWARIPDFSPEAGDIKFVWERGRFTQLQTMMRWDWQSGSDHSSWVWDEIESWIDSNPVNCGPHFRCSQEISLRVMNWLGALSFYRNSSSISEFRWQKIWQSLYWQVHHVRRNIDFSRIAVRNNHAITETLMLYVFGSLFPDSPGCREWRESGKRWFEEEIAYQVYEDGSYLQFSMNYHRVVVQLLTLAIRFAENLGDRFAPVVYERAQASLHFLRFFQDPISGWLPNYGANDGALFFRFSNAHFRDYRPQLEALAFALGESLDPDFDDAIWFGKGKDLKQSSSVQNSNPVQLFPSGGFAGIRGKNSLLMFRCGVHRDRPSQADNLHVDLWYGGRNILRDAGSYKYNASTEDVRYFFGTQSHNTVMVGGQDQMEKGPRFIWLNWSQAIGLEVKENKSAYLMEGSISAFKQLSPHIRHERRIIAENQEMEWLVEDHLSGTQGNLLELLWHPCPGFSDEFGMEVWDQEGNLLEAIARRGWYSENYGIKEAVDYLCFQSTGSGFRTRIYRK
jgi:hypothetical protein